ncbi:MAG: VCBS repeat-containing protein [Saprospiraceae bacterium]|nr:VCBS repeat-containing protein [Saprospiraceae bacterium]
MKANHCHQALFHAGIPFNLLLLLFMISSCSGDKQQSAKGGEVQSALVRLDGSQTGIDFANSLHETEEENVLIYDGFYTGAGTGVLDINNDGRPDLFFASNQGPDKLYLNEGGFRFKDISKTAGVEGDTEWGAGVSVADVNADGFDDIYLCCHMYLDPVRRKNKLYINNGDNTFTERAAEYGLDDAGFSINASFLDYDLDGDLDVYVINQPPNHNTTRNPIMAKGTPDFQYTDRLYRNDGNGKFTDVTRIAGVENFAFGLSATIGDFFNDGWPDIYVANDYDYGDFFYVNNGDGTFRNVSTYSLRHISNFSMGADAADINNDGWLDLFVADMTPEDHYRNKTNMAAMSPETFWKFANTGHNFQYMFNTLQLNQGNGLFSEIGLMAGVAKTDWSWSALFSDFDLDGFKDLYVTNGILRDIRNRDFTAYAFEAFHDNSIPRLEIISKGPSMPLSNYMFRNDGKLHFENVASRWGLADRSFSQGASYADLDGDGDVDLVVNNMNQEAFVYQNRTVDQESANYFRIRLEGIPGNSRSFGARVLIRYGQQGMQMGEIAGSRGFMSSSEPVLTFGMGAAQAVDSVFVRWPGGKFMRLGNLKVNQTLVVRQDDAREHMAEQLLQLVPFILSEDQTDASFGRILHTENAFDDYKREVLIPYKQSTLGPALESGDLNGDGLDDLFLGGSAGHSCKLLLQTPTGKFQTSDRGPWQAYSASEVLDVLFFDADGDGDRDVLTISGSNEFPVGDKRYGDHLYLNDGKARFSDGTSRLPALYFSKGVARAADVDLDGDLDLFLGGRLVPGKYGLSEQSSLLLNEGGKFSDATATWLPSLAKAFECVTSACFADLDRDGDPDLVVAGEWAPVRIFRNERNAFSEQSASLGTDQLYGWWNAVEAADLNGDGWVDLVLGNLGLNSKFKATAEKPFFLYINDFDGNGSWDTYLASKGSEGKLYPVRGRQCSSEQMPFIADKFKTYDHFARASIEEILEGRMDGATIKKATELRSMVLWNTGGGAFQAAPLPPEAQVSTLQSIAFHDFNQDGRADLLLGGNFYNREVETARNDASVGLILLNTGGPDFIPVVNAIAGLQLNRDLRELRMVRGADASWRIVAANNNDQLQAFRVR